MDVLIKACRHRAVPFTCSRQSSRCWCAFVAWQSFLYVQRIYRLGAVSDIAHVPTWIPHSAVSVGFGLMALIVLCAAARSSGGGSLERQTDMSFALGVVPVVLLLLGFPVFLVMLTAVTVALVFYMHVPLAALHQNLFGSINAYALLAIPYFIYAGELMGRGSVAQRLVDFVQGGVGFVRGSLGVTTVGTATIFGAISGVSAAAVATIGKVMYPAMVKAGYPPSSRRTDHRGRRHRHHHTAQHPDDRLWRGGAGIGAATLCGRHLAGSADRPHRRLCDLARQAPNFGPGEPFSASASCVRRCEVYGRLARPSSSSAASMAACSHRPKPPRSRASMRFS